MVEVELEQIHEKQESRDIIEEGHDQAQNHMQRPHLRQLQQEQQGFQTFMAKGCQSCHNGSLFGGNSFRKLGQVKPYETEDLGKYAVSKKDEDKYVFKVPSLRNVALTAPYFHDGKVKTLEEAVKKMGFHQLGLELKDEEIASIVTFLKALTDKNKSN